MPWEEGRRVIMLGGPAWRVAWRGGKEMDMDMDKNGVQEGAPGAREPAIRVRAAACLSPSISISLYAFTT